MILSFWIYNFPIFHVSSHPPNATIGACLGLLSSLAFAEPTQYQGTFGKREITAQLDWQGADKIVGDLTSNDASGHQLTISGINASKGTMKIELSDKSLVLGSATMTKTTTAASIIWTGKFRFTSGDQTILEFRRNREQQ